MGTPRTRPSKEDRDYLGRWVLAVGETTVPLLAGFSFTSAIIVSDDAVNFRWPGPAIVTLGFASVVLIASVQSAYIVRLKLLSGAETPQADVGDAVSSQADQGGNGPEECEGPITAALLRCLPVWAWQLLHCMTMV